MRHSQANYQHWLAIARAVYTEHVDYTDHFILIPQDHFEPSGWVSAPICLLNGTEESSGRASGREVDRMEVRCARMMHGTVGVH